MDQIEEILELIRKLFEIIIGIFIEILKALINLIIFIWEWIKTNIPKLK